MCGRYTAPFKGEDLVKRYHLSKKLSTQYPTYNASPGQQLPIITKNSPLKGVTMKWGFIAPWEKDFTKAKFKPINARNDKLTGGFYRQALKETRCLVPCSGYYEWKVVSVNGKPEKHPYYFKLKKQEIFSFGGLYSVFKDAEGMEHKFFCIITTDPNSLQKPIHDRMPLMFSQEDEEKWLETDNPLKMVKSFESEKWRLGVYQPWLVHLKTMDLN